MEGRNKESLKFYKDLKDSIKEERDWTSSKRDRILKRFHSGTLPLQGRIGKNDQEKNCKTCNTKEDLEHLIKSCTLIENIRKKYDFTNMDMLKVLDLKKKNERNEAFLEEVYKARFEVNGF